MYPQWLHGMGDASRQVSFQHRELSWSERQKWKDRRKHHRPATFRIIKGFLYCESQAAQRDSQEAQSNISGPKNLLHINSHHSPSKTKRYFPEIQCRLKLAKQVPSCHDLGKTAYYQNLVLSSQLCGHHLTYGILKSVIMRSHYMPYCILLMRGRNELLKK